MFALRNLHGASAILSHIEILLQQIVDLISMATIDIGYLIPLLRVALEGVYIESSQLMMCQQKAQGRLWVLSLFSTLESMQLK